MMEKILRAPIPLYFDITPASRIIRSFHHDIRGFDEGFVYQIQDTFNTVIYLSYVIIRAMYVVPFVLLCLPPFCYYKYTKD